MGTSEQWAAWVQAFGSMGAIAAGFLFIARQHYWSKQDKKQERADKRKLIIFVVDRCIEEWQDWAQGIKTNSSNWLVHRATGLPHLDVPLESFIVLDVGNTNFNKAMVVLRKINADVWLQIKSAVVAYEINNSANLNEFTDQIDVLIRAAQTVRHDLALENRPSM